MFFCYLFFLVSTKFSICFCNYTKVIIYTLCSAPKYIRKNNNYARNLLIQGFLKGHLSPFFKCQEDFVIH